MVECGDVDDGLVAHCEFVVFSFDAAVKLLWPAIFNIEDRRAAGRAKARLVQRQTTNG